METNTQLSVAERDYQALKSSMNAIMEHLGLNPENLPDGSYSEVVIKAMQAQTVAGGLPFAYVSPAVLKDFRERQEGVSQLIMQVPLAVRPLEDRECTPIFLNTQTSDFLDLDGKINDIARVAYSYAMHLDEYTRGLDVDEREGITRAATSNLKSMVRKILTVGLA